MPWTARIVGQNSDTNNTSPVVSIDVTLTNSVNGEVARRQYNSNLPTLPDLVAACANWATELQNRDAAISGIAALLGGNVETPVPYVVGVY